MVGVRPGDDISGLENFSNSLKTEYGTNIHIIKNRQVALTFYSFHVMVGLGLFFMLIFVLVLVLRRKEQITSWRVPRAFTSIEGRGPATMPVWRN